MKVLLKKVYILDPESPHHRSHKDILINNGIIAAIGDPVAEPADTIIREPGLFVSPGWIDPFAYLADPGFEYRETLASGAAAAAAGGFTAVFALPNTKPVLDAKTQVEYVIQHSKSLPVDILPIGAITRNTDGKELAEMYDMKNSGAVAFSDGLRPLQPAGLMVKALQYVRAFNGVIIQVPEDSSIAPHGLINEGIVSTRLGLPGKPAIAEELMVARDIKLARYTESALHFTGISSAKSLEYIKRAKDAGLAVSCSVSPAHLSFCDEDLTGYDTNLKLSPPLRRRQDMLALRQAVAEGLIDCIATHHLPQDWDSKTCEFEYAKPGMIGLQTCYPALKTVMPEINDEQWLALLCTNAARIFNLQRKGVAVNAPANLTLFLPGKPFVFTKSVNKSKSQNSPFFDQPLNGSVLGIINGDTLVLNN